MCQLEPAYSLMGCAGKRPLLVSKQLRLKQIFWNGTTIDRDERTVFRLPVKMQHPRDQLFASSALSLNQHGAIATCDLLDKLKHAPDRFTCANELL